MRRSTEQDLIPGVGPSPLVEDHIVAIAAVELVRVAPRAAFQCVVAGAAVERVVACRTIDYVISGRSVDLLTGRASRERVGSRRRDKRLLEDCGGIPSRFTVRKLDRAQPAEP